MLPVGYDKRRVVYVVIPQGVGRLIAIITLVDLIHNQLDYGCNLCIVKTKTKVQPAFE